MKSIVCPLCQKPIKNTESFSVYIYENGKEEHRHLNCNCKIPLNKEKIK